MAFDIAATPCIKQQICNAVYLIDCLLKISGYQTDKDSERGEGERAHPVDWFINELKGSQWGNYINFMYYHHTGSPWPAL